MLNQEQIEAIFKQKGYRITQQRLMVLQVLQNTTSHPTAEEIYHQLKPRMHKISLGTVYRALNVLEKLGLLKKLSYGFLNRYDGRTDEHSHAICVKCSQVLDIEVTDLEPLKKQLTQQTGLLIVDYNLKLYCYCPNCRSSAAVPASQETAGTTVGKFNH